MDLNRKLMLITGASSGIGAATAKLAAQEGARVVLVARSADKLAKVAGEIRSSGGQAYTYPADLTDWQAVSATAEQIATELGTPDVLFNNAGAGRWLYADETDLSEAVAMMAAPYFAAFFMTRALLPAMLQRDSGLIINMTSLAAFLTWPGATAYTAARWAVRGYSEALRADLSGTGVRTMLTCFAAVQSEYWTNNVGSEAHIPAAQKSIPMLSPEEAARAILMGIHQDRDFVTAPRMVKVIITMSQWFPGLMRRR
ncbi:MAG: SDR family oxidoreductase, partial [Anaerolineae bacterium]|nr:SDR family oxidoreductase [Anaerolineae bacterium]